MNTDPLPAAPVPAASVDPACEWCGARPAESYEVEPPILTSKKVDRDGKSVSVKVVKRKAIMAYACEFHREHFDRRKAETRAAQEAERKRRRELRKRGEVVW